MKLNPTSMFAFIYLLANLSMNFLTFEEGDWKLSLDKDEISVYTRSVESSKFKEFLAEAKMKGTIKEFRDIILDVDHYKEWMPDCKSAEIIEFPNPDEITYYMKLKVPFPFADRDIIQQLLLNEREDMLEIEMINRPRKIKESKKFVRMHKAKGKWTIQKKSDEEIAIKFQYFADPGGDVPAWLVNSFVVKNPHITLLNIKDKLSD